MRRRPPFRRRPRHVRGSGPRRAPALPPRVRRALRRAHQHMADEQFAQAAQAFARLTEAAQRHKLPIRAAHLALQAARAHLADDDVEAALPWAERGLTLLARGGQARRASRLLARVQDELRERGYATQAEALSAKFDRMLEEQRVPPDEEVTAEEPRGTLPARCAGCGAALLPDTVEWHAEKTASCAYCGAVVKAS